MTKVCIWLATVTAAVVRLDRVWRSHITSIRLTKKFSKSLAVPIMLYGCEMWTLFIVTERRIMQAFENKCLRRLPRSSYREHKTNDEAWSPHSKDTINSYSKQSSGVIWSVLAM